MRAIKRIKAVGLGLMLGVSVISGTVVQAENKPAKEPTYVSDHPEYWVKTDKGWGKYSNDAYKCKKSVQEKYLIKGLDPSYPKFTGKHKERDKKFYKTYLQEVTGYITFPLGTGGPVGLYPGWWDYTNKMFENEGYLKFSRQLVNRELGRQYVADFVRPLKGARYGYPQVDSSEGVCITQQEYEDIGEQLEELGYREITIKDITYRTGKDFRGRFKTKLEKKYPEKYGWMGKMYLYEDELTHTRILVKVNGDDIRGEYKTKEKAMKREKDYFLTKQDFENWWKADPTRLNVYDYSLGKTDERYIMLKKTLKITHRWDLVIDNYKALQYPDGKLHGTYTCIKFKKPMEVLGYCGLGTTLDATIF